MDLLCQEMRDVCKESSESSGFSSLLVFGVPKMLSGELALFSPWTGCDVTARERMW